MGSEADVCLFAGAGAVVDTLLTVLLLQAGPAAEVVCLL